MYDDFNVTTTGIVIDLDEIYVDKAGRKKETINQLNELTNFVKSTIYDYVKDIRKFELIKDLIEIDYYNYNKTNHGAYVIKYSIKFKHPIKIFYDTISFPLYSINPIDFNQVKIPKSIIKIFRHYIKLINYTLTKKKL